jgi:NitT/TauT family transport system ATP-binding protein
VRALSEISFSLPSGEFASIVGPSGCGKTTLLKMIGDLAPTTEGKILIGDLLPSEARRQCLFSWVFQSPVLLPWRNILQNVTLPLEISRGKQAANPEFLLKLVGLQGFEQRLPNELSGGMQQRAALARALTIRPQVLLMDEPFAAVDELTRGLLNSELLRIYDEMKTTILLVTHSIEEAVFLSDRVIVLSPRPGTIKNIVRVPLPRPRDASVRKSEQFQEIKYCVQSDLS